MIYILLPLSLILGNLRWSKAGRAFVLFQISIGAFWLSYAIQALYVNAGHLRPDLAGILLIAGCWTTARLWELSHAQA
jgi:hypothetical protein